MKTVDGITISNKEDCNVTKVDILFCESCEDCKGTNDAPKTADKAVVEADDTKNVVNFSLEYFGLRHKDLDVKPSVSPPVASAKLLKCHVLCEQSEKHRHKHKVDISSPLGQLITQRDVVDENYKQAKQDKIESFCGPSVPTTIASKSRRKGSRSTLRRTENPVLAEMRNCTRQYYKKV